MHMFAYWATIPCTEPSITAYAACRTKMVIGFVFMHSPQTQQLFTAYIPCTLLIHPHHVGSHWYQHRVAKPLAASNLLLQ
jgi:hypothetical protein